MFWNWKSYVNSYGEAATDRCPITCLVDDHGREIENCPNCNARLICGEIDEDEEEYWDEAPDTCIGCKYYTRNYFVACAVHPYGLDEDICSDWAG